MQFLIGAAGALLFVGVLVFGVFAGWKAHAKYSVQKSHEKVTEEELRRMRQQEEAFRTMNGYSVELAYGLTDAMSEDAVRISDGSDAS